MIAQLAEMAYRKAGQMFFCVQKDARSVTFSYRRARFAAAALAQQLAKRGYGRGTTLACNLYNGAEIVILSLAAVYGGFTLALLNPRLSYEERKLRIVELENATGEAGIDVLEQSAVERLMIDATATGLADFAALPEGSVPHATQFEAFARECEQAWDGQEAGIVMFTSGFFGNPEGHAFAVGLHHRCRHRGKPRFGVGKPWCVADGAAHVPHWRLPNHGALSSERWLVHRVRALQPRACAERRAEFPRYAYFCSG